jgi:hypothetical protein
MLPSRIGTIIGKRNADRAGALARGGSGLATVG